MPCFRGPDDFLIQMKRLSEKRERLVALPTSDLLQQLDEAVVQAIGAVARDAVAQLASERIYGFFLMHYIFESCRVAVLTEAQYERSVREYAKRWPGASAPDRWSPVDCGHYFYREDLTDPTGDPFMGLEGKQQAPGIERIFIRAMRHVRENVITDPRIVLSVMDYTEGPSVTTYAYAELFNDAAALAQLRAELSPGPQWDYLDEERRRIAAI